jgi:hypothetical protein
MNSGVILNIKSKNERKKNLKFLWGFLQFNDHYIQFGLLFTNRFSIYDTVAEILLAGKFLPPRFYGYLVVVDCILH